MITDTLIQGLTQQMVQARVNSVDVRPFQFATLFPVRRVNGFTWSTISNQLGRKNVAADIHSDNSTTVRKRRPMFESAKGDIPFISISRELTRSELKEFQVAYALAKSPDAAQLVQYWGADVDFCFNGVQSELEYIALKLVSNAGTLAFNTTTNATMANEFNLDYDVDEDLKMKTSTNWGNASNADVIGDLREAVKAAREKNLHPRYALVNMETFYKICSSAQIIKACASFVANAVGVAQTPSLEQVNKMLSSQAFLYGLQLHVIDQNITREFSDGTFTSGNPFENDRVVLCETLILGSTQYDVLAEPHFGGIRTERAHTVIKKYGVDDPYSEVTLGQSDAIPVFDTAYRNVYLRTDAQGW